MKKELKQLIKEKKLSDDEIMKIIQKSFETTSERDTMDEDDESEEQTDSKESANAESQPAQKETAKPTVLSKADLTKMIAEGVVAALKATEEANKYPAQKPIKKSEPKAKPSETAQLDYSGGFQLVG
jgi:phage I-like protein